MNWIIWVNDEAIATFMYETDAKNAFYAIKDNYPRDYVELENQITGECIMTKRRKWLKNHVNNLNHEELIKTCNYYNISIDENPDILRKKVYKCLNRIMIEFNKDFKMTKQDKICILIILGILLSILINVYTYYLIYISG